MHDVNKKKLPGAIFNSAQRWPTRKAGKNTRYKKYRLSPLFLALALPTTLLAEQTQYGEMPDASHQTSTVAPRVNINEYIVRGNTVLTAREIEKAVYPFLGPQRVLSDMEGAQEALQKVYQDKGFHSVYVSLPEQQVQDGVVYLQVTETRVGRVRVVGAKYHSPLNIRNEVPALAENNVPNFKQVQEQLTTINSDGYREVAPTVKDGMVPGTMDVDLNVNDRNPWSGSLALNNDYSADTKKLRSIATLSNANLWQRGHSASMTFMTAPQKTDNSTIWSGSYAMPLDERWRLNFSGYHSNSNVASVGGTNVLGRGHSIGATASYTLPLAQEWIHSLSLGLELKDFKENVQFGATKDTVPIRYAPLTVGWNGYYLGEQLQGNAGLNLSWATNHFLGYGDDEAAFDYKRYNAEPDFVVLKGNGDITQSFAGDWQFALSGTFQIASGPLISNEQFSAGGVNSVRGYLASEYSADDGVITSTEVRTPSLAPFIGSPLNELRLFAFFDGARLWLRDPLPEQQDRFNLASVGVGAKASAWSWLNSRLDLGIPLNDTTNTDRYAPRVHFSASVDF